MLVYICATHGIVDQKVTVKIAGIKFHDCPACYKPLSTYNLQAMLSSPHCLKDVKYEEEDDGIPF